MISLLAQRPTKRVHFVDPLVHVDRVLASHDVLSASALGLLLLLAPAVHTSGPRSEASAVLQATKGVVCRNHEAGCD